MITELQIDDYSRTMWIWPIDKAETQPLMIEQRGSVMGKPNRPLMATAITCPHQHMEIIQSRAFLSALAVAVSTAEEWDKLTGQPITLLAELADAEQAREERTMEARQPLQTNGPH